MKKSPTSLPRMKNTECVKTALYSHQPGELIRASSFYHTLDSSITEVNYFKILERLVEKEELLKIGKGFYAIPKKTKFGPVSPSESKIISTFIPKEEHGCEIGYGLYCKYGLTTQVSKRRTFLTRNIETQQLKIGNFLFYKANLHFSPELISVLEMLEILQHFETIEDFEPDAFECYVNIWLPKYNEEKLKDILAERPYKKRTIAFLKDILDEYHVSNRLQLYLSNLSTYQIPHWKKEKNIPSDRAS